MPMQSYAIGELIVPEQKASSLTINEVIRAAREAADLSQESVASAAGITQATYSRFEAGLADPGLDVVFRIKDFIDPHPRTKTKGVPLWSMIDGSISDAFRNPVKKLTEQIARELEAYAEVKRKSAEAKERKEVLEEAAELEREAAKVEPLQAEIARLKAKLADARLEISKLKAAGSKQRPGASSRKKHLSSR
jgi:transcriptional regulator with XRE-family HTH domain